MILKDLKRAGSVSDFSDLMRLLSQVLKLLPNDQHQQLETENVKSLYNYDFRKKKRVPMNKEGDKIEAAHIDAYGKRFHDLYLFGTFVYAHTEGIAGQTHLGDLLFVQPCPTRPFESRLQLGPLLSAPLTIDDYAYRQAEFFFVNFGLDYMKACFEYATEQGAPGVESTLLILGDRYSSGRDGNFEPYHNYCNPPEEIEGLHKYTWNKKAQLNGIQGVKNIYHANIPGFENQHVDSPDIETFYKIYSESIAANSPLMIHCTDGLDRAGCYAFAFHLLHNWDRIFKEKSAAEIAKNIIAEHEKMQNLRGPSFCTATNRRLQGIVQFAMLLKTVEITTELLNKESCKDYIQKLFILEYLINNPSSIQKLLKQILTERANIECDYFEEFAQDIPHPEINLWRIEKTLKEHTKLAKEEPYKPWIAMFTLMKNNYTENGFPKTLEQRFLTDTQLLILLINIKLVPTPEKYKQTILEKMKTLELKKDSNKEKFSNIMLIFLEVEKMHYVKKIEEFFYNAPVNLEKKHEELKKEFEAIRTKTPTSRKVCSNQIQKLKNILESLESPEPTEQSKSKISPRLTTSLNAGLKVLRRSTVITLKTSKRGSETQIPSKDSSSNEVEDHNSL